MFEAHLPQDLTCNYLSINTRFLATAQNTWDCMIITTTQPQTQEQSCVSIIQMLPSSGCCNVLFRTQNNVVIPPPDLWAKIFLGKRGSLHWNFLWRDSWIFVWILASSHKNSLPLSKVMYYSHVGILAIRTFTSWAVPGKLEHKTPSTVSRFMATNSSLLAPGPCKSYYLPPYNVTLCSQLTKWGA